MEYTLQKFISDVSSLTVGQSYSYPSGRNTFTIETINDQTGAIGFRRGASPHVLQISAGMVEKLVQGLNTKAPVRVENLYSGGGNARSAIEAIAANTPEVFLCWIDGKKYIFWDPDKQHEPGTIVEAPPPTVAAAPVTVTSAILALKQLVAQYPENEMDTLTGWLNRLESSTKVDLTEEFREWLRSEYKDKDGENIKPNSVSSYVNALLYLTDSESYPGRYDVRSVTYWYNMYHFLYGCDGPSVFTVSKESELKERYANIIAAVNLENAPEGVDVNNFNEVKAWCQEPKTKKSGWIKSAFNRYLDFLEWRKARKNKAEPKVSTSDLLTVALKMFAAKRKDDGEGGWFKSGCEVNGRIREYFDPLTKEALAGFGETQITELFIGKKNADGKVEFNPMWSGSNGTGWDHIKIDSADDVKEIVDALIQYKTDAGVVSKFLDKGFVRPKGFGPSVVSELLMKFHPESCIKHGQRSHKALEWLGLIDFQWKPQYTSDEFKQVCGAAAKILAKMKAMKIAKKINADGSEDTSPPDYLTVNEFLYFVDTNLEKIKEEVMSKEFKNVSKKAKAGARKLSKAVENDEMLQRLMAALRTKPFAILAGHSGTGKSQLVRRLAYMTCNDEELLKEKDNSNAPGNYCMVQVKPNWHDSTDLLGYYTEMNGGKYHTTPFVEFICKAYAYPETPFFVCLDEMNLAPVEQYFAEFLSAIESYSETTKLTDRLITEKASPEEICGETKLTESLEEVKKHGLTIPRNLFVVGTVNVDETTCQFSRKVLDRAMTILMTAVSFKSMTEPNDPSKEECLDPDGIKFFLERPTQATLVQGQMDKLDAIQKQVGDSPFAIAYRFANEYALYQSAYQMLKGQGLKPDGKTPDPDNADSQKTAIDHVVLIKLLPRIHGARPEMEVWFNGKNGDANKIGLVKTLGDGQSVDMMKSILARVGEYLSFWP